MAFSSYLGSLDTSLVLKGLTGAWLVWYIGGVFYNIFLHPLANVPGPFLCKFSKIPWVCLSLSEAECA